MARNEEQPAGQARQRIDKWLFFARLRKSRSLAAKSVESGDVSVNGVNIRQPSYAVRPGDVVMIKSSKGTGCGRIVDALKQQYPAVPTPGETD